MNPVEESNNYFKQKRDEYLVEIRKKKSIDQIQAKRTKFALSLPQSNNTNDSFGQANEQITLPLGDLALMFINNYHAGNISALSETTEAIRKAVSMDDNPPIDELIKTEIVPYIIEMLQPEFFNAEQLMIECSWIANNIVSRESEYVNYLVGLNIIPKAILLLGHPNIDVKDNAIWILANITGESLVYRNDILKKGIVSKIEEVLNEISNKEAMDALLSDITWLISNICRGKPYPQFYEIAPFLKYLQAFIKNSKIEDILIHCMWALAYLSDGDDTQIQEILEMDIVDEMLKLLESNNSKLTAPTLRTIGNLLTGADEQAQVLIDRGAIEALYPLLNDGKKLIRKEACWAFSNILGGNPQQVKEVFRYDNAMVIDKLFEMIPVDHKEIAEECIYALTNACDVGEVEELIELVDKGFIELLVEVLKVSKNPPILRACLQAINSILSKGGEISIGSSPEENPFFVRMLECNGFTVIEMLQNFPSNEVYEVIEKIFQKYNV